MSDRAVDFASILVRIYAKNGFLGAPRHSKGPLDEGKVASARAGGARICATEGIRGMGALSGPLWSSWHDHGSFRACPCGKGSRRGQGIDLRRSRARPRKKQGTASPPEFSTGAHDSPPSSALAFPRRTVKGRPPLRSPVSPAHDPAHKGGCKRRTPAQGRPSALPTDKGRCLQPTLQAGTRSMIPNVNNVCYDPPEEGKRSKSARRGDTSSKAINGGQLADSASETRV